MIRHLKKLSLIIFILTIAFALSACTESVETERGNSIKAQCAQMMDAMIANDAEAALALFSDAVDKAAFRTSFSELSKHANGISSYTLKQIGWRSGIENGIQYYQASFEMKCEKGVFTVIAMEAEGHRGLYSFRLISGSADIYTGTLTTLKGANAAQYALIVLSAVSIAFGIWMIADCIKHKMKNTAKWYKPLWIAIIAIGMLVFTFTCGAAKTNLSVNLGMLFGAYSYWKIYASGAYILRIVIPVGAIVYFFKRKSITYSEDITPEDITHETIVIENGADKEQ